MVHAGAGSSAARARGTQPPSRARAQCPCLIRSHEGNLGGIQPGLEWRNEARRLTNAVVPVSPAVTSFRLVLESFQVCTIVGVPSSLHGTLDTGQEDPCALAQYLKPSGRLLTAMRATMRSNTRSHEKKSMSGLVLCYWRHPFPWETSILAQHHARGASYGSMGHRRPAEQKRASMAWNPDTLKGQHSTAGRGSSPVLAMPQSPSTAHHAASCSVPPHRSLVRQRHPVLHRIHLLTRRGKPGRRACIPCTRGPGR